MRRPSLMVDRQRLTTHRSSAPHDDDDDDESVSRSSDQRGLSLGLFAARLLVVQYVVVVVLIRSDSSPRSRSNKRPRFQHIVRVMFKLTGPKHVHRLCYAFVLHRVRVRLHLLRSLLFIFFVVRRSSFLVRRSSFVVRRRGRPWSSSSSSSPPSSH
jgi:hypothetical protein